MHHYYARTHAPVLSRLTLSTRFLSISRASVRSAAYFGCLSLLFYSGFDCRSERHLYVSRWTSKAQDCGTFFHWNFAVIRRRWAMFMWTTCKCADLTVGNANFVMCMKKIENIFMGALIFAYEFGHKNHSTVLDKIRIVFFKQKISRTPTPPLQCWVFVFS